MTTNQVIGMLKLVKAGVRKKTTAVIMAEDNAGQIRKALAGKLTRPVVVTAVPVMEGVKLEMEERDESIEE